MKAVTLRLRSAACFRALFPALTLAGSFAVIGVSHATVPGPSASASINPECLTSGWAVTNQYCESTTGNPTLQGITGQSISASVGGGGQPASSDATTMTVNTYTYSGSSTSSPPSLSVELHISGSAFAYGTLQHASSYVYQFEDARFGGTDDQDEEHMFSYAPKSSVVILGQPEPGETAITNKIKLEVHAKNR